MKYFTRERYLALQQRGDAAMDTADTEWECAADAYETYLQSIRTELPETVRLLLEGFFLHDARVLSMGQRNDTFVISLRLDSPPNELLMILYTLAGSPEVRQETFPGDMSSSSPLWLHEEIELIRGATGPRFVHSILFSNGWEIRLPFRDVQMMTAAPLYPPPHFAPSAPLRATAVTI